jgi:hypothetical protein
MSALAPQQQAASKEDDSIGSVGLGQMKLTTSQVALARITEREARIVADLEQTNQALLEARLARARATLNADNPPVGESSEDEDAFMEMEEPNEAKADQPSRADELLIHAARSGYYNAVPSAFAPDVQAVQREAAAAAGVAAVNRGRKRAVPGAAISFKAVAEAVTANDIKPESIVQWKTEGAKMRNLRTAIATMASTASKDGTLIRVADDIPAYAFKKHRSITLPESVSDRGLREHEQSANIAAADIGKTLNQMLKLADEMDIRLYKTARCNYVLRHYRKKWAAQEKEREAAAAKKVEEYVLSVQGKMEKNGAYQARHLEQAAQRQKVSTSDGKKKDFYAEDD